MDKLYAYNNLSHKNKIYEGQVLRLPGRGHSVSPAIRISNRKKFKRSYSSETTSYRVRRNDNLSKIARRFDTDVDELLQLNRINNPDQLFPGQRLKVPQEMVVTQASKKNHSKQ